MFRRIFLSGLVLALAGIPVIADDDRENRREKEKAGDWWRMYDGIDFPEDKFADGDSFHLLVPLGNRKEDWSIRLYGIDCPETDERFPDRLAEQAKELKLPDNQAVLRWGKKAKERTMALLKEAKVIRLHVKSRGKEKTRKADGQTQRFYGIVELEMADGKLLLLHETLLKEGLAVPGADQAPWPPEREAKDGEEEAEKEFRRDNERASNQARREKQGIWGEAGGGRAAE